MLFDPKQNVNEVRSALPGSLSEMATAIQREHAAAEAAAKASVQHARNAGELLIAAKRQLGHGKFKLWIAAHCKFSYRTARDYMRVAERWDELSKVQRAALFSLRDFFRVLLEHDELFERLTPEGRHALESGLIDAAAARQLLRLEILDKIATQRPLGIHQTWADRAAKFILWRPSPAVDRSCRLPRTEAELRFEVASAICDVAALQDEYADLAPSDADAKAAEILARERITGSDGRDPEQYWAYLWREMQPDFERLEPDDVDAIIQAAEQYAGAAV